MRVRRGRNCGITAARQGSQMRPRIRFWQKVLAALLVVGVAPIAIVSVVSTHNTRNDLTSLGVTNIRQRSTSTATDEGTSVAFREYFLTALKGTPYVSDPSYSVITNKPALFFSSPVAANGVVVAVVRTRVNLAAIWDIVEADAGSVGVGAHSFLVDDYGIRLAVS